MPEAAPASRTADVTGFARQVFCSEKQKRSCLMHRVGPNDGQEHSQVEKINMLRVAGPNGPGSLVKTGLVEAFLWLL